MNSKEENKGIIVSIDGPVIVIENLDEPKIGDMVKIGHKRLLGEIIKINGKKSIAQCYDNTEGLKNRELVENTKMPLSMELGPGLLNNIYDGLQRPLNEFGNFLESGIEKEALSKVKKWTFIPTKKVGDVVSFGDIIGEVKETNLITHKIMVPFGVEGIINEIKEGDFTVNDKIYEIKINGTIQKFNMVQKWSIRQPRPFIKHYYPEVPLITGLRVIDLLFPVAKGGAVAVPGGFGTGKTVIQQNIAKFADADIIIYIGCGERGNEMVDVLEQFPKLLDPNTNRPIMERTVLIANTSNMPVSAREASIFSGLTIAEYYRDMGYNICILADSTSRWAESLREISGRLEEMPTEGGFPAYLASKLASFYERSGVIRPFGNPIRSGSITLIGAVSPPSGDFSEPVTKTTKRFTRTFWALDAKLAYSRHYPSINWRDSYSLYHEIVYRWWDKNIEPGWNNARIMASEILAKNDELQNIIQLIGQENLPNEQQLIIFTASLIKQAFLIQSAYDPIDRYTSPQKLLKLIKLILNFHEKSRKIINLAPISRIREIKALNDIVRAKTMIPNNNLSLIDDLENKMNLEFDLIRENYKNIGSLS